MIKYSILIITIIITLFSCDGRYNTKKQPVDRVAAKELLMSFTENVKYFPEGYTEFTNDTILSNGYTVKIKNYSDMENNVLQTFKRSTTTNKHYFREVITEVEVYKNNKQIFKHVLDDAFLSLSNTDYVLNQVYIDEIKSLNTNTLHLVASACIPRTDNCPVYNIAIDPEGEYLITKI